MVKIALIGYGKMGKMVEKAALERNHEIVSIIDPAYNNTSISPASLANADICIEFTSPHSILDNIQRALALKKPLVTGTTGWEASIEQVKEWVAKSDTGLFYAPNFSLGVNLFLKTVEAAASLFLQNSHYDVAGMEIHHNQKLDTPSGTALKMQKTIAKAANIPCSNIPLTSVRCGSAPGTHTVYFDSPEDLITITHQARSREGFAQGAVACAEWMVGKKGIYTMEDFLCLN